MKKFELTGGSIINAVHYASLKAVERQRHNGSVHVDAARKNQTDPANPNLVIYLTDVIQGIKKELTKEGKPFLG